MIYNHECIYSFFQTNLYTNQRIPPENAFLNNLGYTPL